MTPVESVKNERCLKSNCPLHTKAMIYVDTVLNSPHFHLILEFFGSVIWLFCFGFSWHDFLEMVVSHKASTNVLKSCSDIVSVVEKAYLGNKLMSDKKSDLIWIYLAGSGATSRKNN